jgi:hypothetical protein
VEHPDSYVCASPGAVWTIHLPEYTSGSSKLLVAAPRAAKVTAWVAEPDGSFDATVRVGNAGSFTLTTDTRDNLAPSEQWTLHVGVVPQP